MEKFPGVLVERVAGAAEDVFDFVADEVFDIGAGGSEVFTWIKFLRVFHEDLANAGGHGNPQIGIDVYLGAAGTAGDFDIGLRHTLGIRHLAAVLVDFGHQMLRHAGAPCNTSG